MALSAIIYIGNDNDFIVDELKDDSTGSYENSATVEATLKDAAGVEIAGQTWPR